MSQVLEKPILLDETGQDISSKINGVGGKIDSNGEAIVDALEDIKDALATSSEFIPIRIRVATPPIKTSYMSGDTLDLTGISVMLVASNGLEADITTECTFSPANGATLTTANASVTVSYTYPKDSTTFTTTQAIAVKELSSISVTTPPTKTAYKAGEALDLTGIAVMATYNDGSVLSVTNDCTFSPTNGTTLTTSDTAVTVSYTSGGTTKTTTQAISVKEVASIAITTPPTTIEYDDGDTLDLTGIVVTATYTDNSTADVTSSCTFSPADGATLSTSDTTVTATFTESGLTKTATQAITVSAPVYGVEWEGTSSSAWTRTGAAANFTDPNPAYQIVENGGNPFWNSNQGSPFDNIAPWSGMEIVEDSTAGTLVKIPKFWYRLSQQSEGVGLKVEIANQATSGFSVSPAHMEREVGEGERDYVYVGRYICDANFKSTTGVAHGSYQTRNNARTSIANLGADIWQMDFAMYFTIWLLYIVEYADWDCITKIGGMYEGGSFSSRPNNGITDDMPYHTGIKSQLYNPYEGASNGNSRQQCKAVTQYRHIEGLWEFANTWLDGIYYDQSASGGICEITYPADFNDSVYGVDMGTVVNGYPKAYTVKTLPRSSPAGRTFYPIFIPSESGGSYSTYSKTSWYRHSGKPCLYTEGNATMRFTDSNRPNFMSIADCGANEAYGLSRLMKLPNS